MPEVLVDISLHRQNGVMDPEITLPDYLPDEAITWAQQNRALLELVVEELLATGVWPELNAMTRKLAREGRPVPLERVLNDMPRPLGFLDHGLDRRVVLLLYGLRMTYAGQKLLAGFFAALRTAKERYAAESDDDPVLSRADVAHGTPDTDPYVNALGEILLREAPFLGGGSGQASDSWSREITSSIVQYWSAGDTEAYLRMRAEELKVIPQFGWNPPPLPSSAQIAASFTGDDEAVIPQSRTEPLGSLVTHSRDVFISHASEDKDDVARPLADTLTQRGWTTWLDELELTVGDSLSGRIDAALAHARFGVVVLSPAFFSKPWPQRELAGLAAREIDTGSKVILPVWHNVDHQFIVQRSPVLADRLGVQTSAGLNKVAEEIALALENAGVHPTKAPFSGAMAQAVEAADESDGVSLFSIPTTAEEQAGLINEQPEWWEYRLYAGVLMQGRIELEGKWRDHELQLPRGERREPDPESVTDFFSREIGWMSRQVGSLDRIFDQAVLEKAFGAPGEAGDAARITHVAQGVIQIYASMMEWAAALRNTSVPSEYEEILELNARMADGPIRQIREFVQDVADQIARIPFLIEEAAAGGATKDSPMVLTLTLNLSLDESNQEALHAALERMRDA
jgi:hypothetical protein